MKIVILSSKRLHVRILIHRNKAIVRPTLMLHSCSPNFPRASITRDYYIICSNSKDDKSLLFCLLFWLDVTDFNAAEKRSGDRYLRLVNAWAIFNKYIANGKKVLIVSLTKCVPSCKSCATHPSPPPTRMFQLATPTRDPRGKHSITITETRSLVGVALKVSIHSILTRHL